MNLDLCKNCENSKYSTGERSLVCHCQLVTTNIRELNRGNTAYRFIPNDEMTPDCMDLDVLWLHTFEQDEQYFNKLFEPPTNCPFMLEHLMKDGA